MSILLQVKPLVAVAQLYKLGTTLHGS